MALDLNTDRRIVGPSARRALVEAIRDAEPHEPETFWLEWKSEANLKVKAWRGEIASHVLAFANRAPEVATRAAEGQAYLAIGVSPGQLKGVTPADPAELEDWLAPYLGGVEGPQWDPDYVSVDGKQVLLISVEPPRQGDRIWTLRKGFTDPSDHSHHDGQVFVRRNGKTVPQPSSAEFRMLEQRLVAETTHLGLELGVLEGPPLRTIDMSDETRKRWIAAKRREMLESLGAQGDQFDLTTRLIGDSRTSDEYREEVNTCLFAASKSFAGMAVTVAVMKGIGRVEFAITNQTDDNLPGLLVELRVKDKVHAFFSQEDAADAAEAPKAPRPYGAPNRVAPFPVLRDRVPLHSFNPGTIATLESGVTQIQFPVTHLRPGYQVSLDPIYLIPDVSTAGSSLEVYWHATSDAASGSANGIIKIPVADQVLGLDDLQVELDKDK